VRSEGQLEGPQLQAGALQTEAICDRAVTTAGHPGERGDGRGEHQRPSTGEPGVKDPLGTVQSARGGKESKELCGDGFEVGLHRAQGLGEFPAADGEVLGPEGPGAAGPVGDVGIGPVAAEPRGQVVADGLLGPEEGVGEGQVHPAEQGGVGGGVGTAVVGGAADPPVHAPDPRRLPLGEFRGAEGAHGEPARGPGEAGPGVAAVGGVPRHPGHRQRVRALPQECRDPADEGGEVAVDSPDDAVRLEPARSFSDQGDVTYPVRRTGGVAGDPGAEGAADAVTQVGGARDRTHKHDAPTTVGRVRRTPRKGLYYEA
jgi:hypothetical protein